MKYWFGLILFFSAHSPWRKIRFTLARSAIKRWMGMTRSLISPKANPLKGRAV